MSFLPYLLLRVSDSLQHARHKGSEHFKKIKTQINCKKKGKEMHIH